VPYRTLQDYLAGRRMPGAEHLQRIAATGIVDMTWLLTGRRLAGAPWEEAVGSTALAGADIELLRSVMARALTDVDAYADRFFRRTGTPLRPSQSLLALAYFSVSIGRVVQAMADYVAQLRQQGLGGGALIDKLMAFDVSDLDPKLDQVVGASDVDEQLRRFLDASRSPQ